MGVNRVIDSKIRGVNVMMRSIIDEVKEEDFDYTFKTEASKVSKEDVIRDLSLCFESLIDMFNEKKMNLDFIIKNLKDEETKESLITMFNDFIILFDVSHYIKIEMFELYEDFKDFLDDLDEYFDRFSIIDMRELSVVFDNFSSLLKGEVVVEEEKEVSDEEKEVFDEE
jgi:hypothetical protein